MRAVLAAIVVAALSACSGRGGGPLASLTTEYEYEEAKKMYAIAQAAWAPAKNAPIGMKYATQMGLGIIKARSVERAAPTNLAVQIIQMTAPPTFPELILPAEEE